MRKSSNETMKQQVTLTCQAIRTPRAAAVAGIIFSVLFTTSMVLIWLAIPEELSGMNIATWLQGNTTTISLALTLVPFAGIAFLRFIGVVRSHPRNITIGIEPNSYLHYDLN